MAQSTIRVEGLRELRAALRKAERDAGDLKAAGLEAARPVEETAKQKARRKTGRMAGTIRAAGQASGAVVRAGYASDPYVPVQHFGWPGHRIEPNPFLYDALDERRDEVFKIYQKRVDKIADSV